MDNGDWVRAERSRRIVGFVGGYLIEIGAITLEDLDRGLEEQLKISAQGQEMRLGQVLIQMRKITAAQLDHALRQQDLEESQRLRRALIAAKGKEKK